MANGNGNEGGWAVFGKVIGVLILIAAGIGVVWWVGNVIYNSGYKQAERDGQQAVNELNIKQAAQIEAKNGELVAQSKAHELVAQSNQAAHLLLLDCLNNASCKAGLLRDGIELQANSLEVECIKTPGGNKKISYPLTFDAGGKPKTIGSPTITTAFSYHYCAR